MKATSNMQPRSQGWRIQFTVTAKSKGYTTNEKIVDCWYQDMVSPMYDESYDEGFQEDYFWWKLRAGASSIDIYINNKLERSGFENKGKMIKNDIWIC